MREGNSAALNLTRLASASKSPPEIEPPGSDEREVGWWKRRESQVRSTKTERRKGNAAGFLRKCARDESEREREAGGGGDWSEKEGRRVGVVLIWSVLLLGFAICGGKQLGQETKGHSSVKISKCYC
jgi:hypothetical protein